MGAMAPLEGGPVHYNTLLSVMVLYAWVVWESRRHLYGDSQLDELH